jgi:fido (protein-threonine AMPylation protein)
MVLVWEPITDLPQDWSALTDGELGPLLQFWKDQRVDLEQSGALVEFNQRLGREWSIETGQIEGVYNLDRGITETLIERGIDADLIGNLPGQKPPEIIAAIIQDHADVLEGLFQFVKGDRALSKSYIHELHAALLCHQETTAVRDQFGNLFEAKLLKGKYKERANNPKKPDGSMHQYCPPEQVESEMERLLSLHAEHEKKGVPVEVEAAWLHHRFTQVHPYQDGNGRVARALASLLFIKAGWFPVVVTREDRARYIDALEVADEGDLRHLVYLFIDMQKRKLIELMQTVADAQGSSTPDDVIIAARRILTASGNNPEPRVWLAAKEIADRLMNVARRRLGEIAHSLSMQVGTVRSEFAFSHGTTYDLRPALLPYKPRREEYERIAPLMISKIRKRQSIEVQAHAVGTKYAGLIGIITVFGSGAEDAVVVSKDFFQVNYAESYESAERRFRPWLEESLVNALTLWRKSL